MVLLVYPTCYSGLAFLRYTSMHPLGSWGNNNTSCSGFWDGIWSWVGRVGLAGMSLVWFPTRHLRRWESDHMQGHYNCFNSWVGGKTVWAVKLCICGFQINCYCPQTPQVTDPSSRTLIWISGTVLAARADKSGIWGVGLHCHVLEWLKYFQLDYCHFQCGHYMDINISEVKGGTALFSCSSVHQRNSKLLQNRKLIPKLQWSHGSRLQANSKKSPGLVRDTQTGNIYLCIYR